MKCLLSIQITDIHYIIYHNDNSSNKHNILHFNGIGFGLKCLSAMKNKTLKSNYNGYKWCLQFLTIFYSLSQKKSVLLWFHLMGQSIDCCYELLLILLLCLDKLNVIQMSPVWALDRQEARTSNRNRRHSMNTCWLILDS